MKTIPDIIDSIVRPSHADTRVSIMMLLIACRMIYGGDYS